MGENKIMQQESISVVIPVYNSAQSLPETVRRLRVVLDAIAAHFEVVFVEDGSRDDSWIVVRNLAAEYSFVTAIRLMRNYGQHNALLCGIRAARYPVIATIDDDLQNPPEEIPKLLAKLAEGFDVVYGTPMNEQHGFLRDVASFITKFAMQTSMGAETARKVSAFRVFRTQLREAFRHYGGPYVSIDVLLTWGTRRFGAVTVRHDARQHGHSNYTLRLLIRHAFNMITGFSTVPLRVASVIGFTFTAVGGTMLLYILGRYMIQGVKVPGFAFLGSAISVLSGAQLFALGIMGEYLARMYSRMMDRPAYTVAEHSSGEAIPEMALSAFPENK